MATSPQISVLSLLKASEVKRWGSPTKMVTAGRSTSLAACDWIIAFTGTGAGAPLRHHIPTIKIEIVGE
jgi:hypothetical protein